MYVQVLCPIWFHSDRFDTAKCYFEKFVRISSSPNENVNLHYLIGNTDGEQSKIKENENI